MKFGYAIRTVALLSVLMIVSAQGEASGQIDSLSNAIKKSRDDSNKVKLLNDLAYELLFVDPVKGLENARAASSLSDELGWVKGKEEAERMISNNYVALSDYAKALKHSLQALKLSEQLNNNYSIASANLTLGVIYLSTHDTTKAIKHYERALEIYTRTGEQKGMATCLNNLGNVFSDKKQFNVSLEHYNQALEVFTTLNDTNGIAMVLVNIGSAYEGLSDYVSALGFYQRSRALYGKIGLVSGVAINNNNIGHSYFKIASGTNITYVPDSLRNRTILLQRSENHLLQALASAYQIKNLQLIKNASSHLSNVYVELNKPDQALEYFRQSVEARDSIYSQQNREQLTVLTRQREEDLNLQQIELQKAQLEKADLQQKFMIAGFVAIIAIAVTIAYQNNRISKERDRSDALLLNILPRKTATELKLMGTAAPRAYNEATVIFTDFKDFTLTAAQLTPTELVMVIDEYYRAFDQIIVKHNIEKIKTIGDAYMCVSGVPEPDDAHAVKAIRAAIEICNYVNSIGEKRKAEGKPFFSIRIGISSGPVVAGIVGEKKFAYDIWGDTVNLAARMETNGEPGKINISHSTFVLAGQEFKFIYRGKIKAKNKGEVDMYFVENLEVEPVVINA